MTRKALLLALQDSNFSPALIAVKHTGVAARILVSFTRMERFKDKEAVHASA
jgi:hypothetical protein